MLTYFPETEELLRWSDGTTLRVPFAGEVLALAARANGQIELAVGRCSGVWLLRVSPGSGDVESETFLPGVRPPLLLRPNGLLVFPDGSEIVVRAPDAADRRIGLPGPAERLEEFGESWVRVVVNEKWSFALRLSNSGEALHRLPGASR